MAVGSGQATADLQEVCVSAGATSSRTPLGAVTRFLTGESMLASFVSLAVIPALRLTNRGPVDGVELALVLPVAS